MRFLGNLQMLLLAGVAFSLIASAIVSTVVPLLVRHTSTWAPGSRHKALTFLGLAPPMLTLAALLSALAPSVLAFAWPELDHCSVHEGHAHLCFVHLSREAGTTTGWVIIAAAVTGLAARSGHRVFSWMNALRLVKCLLEPAPFDAGRQTWVVPTEQPLCFSIGVFRPRVFVSAGLLATASDQELEVMLAHETAHVQRRDTLARCLVRAGSLLLLPHSRRLLVSALELSAEQACDEAAAVQIGDRLRIAETIVAMERRLACAAGYPMVAAFGASSVSDRVESMLLPPRSPGAGRSLGLLFIGALIGVLAASPHLHHVTESTLALLAH